MFHSISCVSFLAFDSYPIELFRVSLLDNTSFAFERLQVCPEQVIGQTVSPRRHCCVSSLIDLIRRQIARPPYDGMIELSLRSQPTNHSRSPSASSHETQNIMDRKDQLPSDASIDSRLLAS